MPDYEGEIVYVDALTSDAASEEILQRYPTRYIPMSVFVASDGTVAETFVGMLTESQMRAKLDSLLE